MTKALIFDTETTGLVTNRAVRLDKQPEVTEFYGCIIDLKKPDKIIEELNTLVKPNGPIPDEIAKKTGITNEMVKDAPPFSSVMPKIKTIISKAPLVVAHNFSFDKDMIEIELQRNNENITWPRCICTVEATIHITGFRLSLTALHEKLFGEPFKGAHRAKADVLALVRCTAELFKRGELV